MCGGNKFSVTAHVTQSWEVDQNGNFIKEISSCDDVLHSPNDEDVWHCIKCGYAAAGSKFCQ